MEQEKKKKFDAASEALETNTFLGVLAGIANAVDTASSQKTPAKFICFFECKNCNNQVSATGTAQIPIANTESPRNPTTVKVEYFSPPVPMFPINQEVPDSVATEMLQAFNHFHSDLSSSGAKLRRSVEKLCLELGYKEKNLHFTISALQKDHPTEGGLLNSLKLLGNEAAHSDSVDESDILNAFEVQEVILDIFPRVKLRKLAEENAAKLIQKFQNKNLTTS